MSYETFASGLQFLIIPAVRKFQLFYRRKLKNSGKRLTSSDNRGNYANDLMCAFHSLFINIVFVIQMCNEKLKTGWYTVVSIGDFSLSIAINDRYWRQTLAWLQGMRTRKSFVINTWFNRTSCCFSVAVDEPNKSEEVHAAAASAHNVTGAPRPSDEDVSLALILPLLNRFWMTFTYQKFELWNYRSSRILLRRTVSIQSGSFG